MSRADQKVAVNAGQAHISDAEYVQSALREFRERVSPGQFRQQPTLTPERALTAGELRALQRVGLAPTSETAPRAERARKNALFSFFEAYQSAHTANEVATMLGVNASRVRQRVKEHSLIALTDAGEMRFPALQFERNKELPGLREVLRAMPQDIKAMEVLAWLTTPTRELAEGESARTPRDFLLETGDVHAVVELAKALQCGEAS